MPKAPHREQLLITARLHEKGLLGIDRRGRAKEEGGPDARRAADHLRRRRGGLVRPRRTVRRLPGRADRGRSVLQGAAPNQPAASRGQPRTGPLLRGKQATRPRLAVRGGLHRIVAGHSARLAHAGSPGDANRQVGQDDRPVGARDRAGTRVPQGPGREAAPGPPVLAPPGDTDPEPCSTTADIGRRRRFARSRSGNGYDSRCRGSGSRIGQRDWDAADTLVARQRKGDKALAATWPRC